MLLCLLGYFVWFMAKGGEEPKFRKTPFSEDRKDYFKHTGLSDSIPKDKYNWGRGKLKSYIADE